MNRTPGYCLFIGEGVVDLQEWEDHYLAERGAAGDRDAFATLAGRYLEPLWTLIRYRVGNWAEAEDVLQDTLLLAWLRLPQLRDADRFKSWLLTIAGNECRRHHRRKGARELPAGDLPGAAAQGAVASGTGASMATGMPIASASRYGRGAYRDQLETKMDLADAVAGLPPAQQELVKGFYIEGFSLAELAAKGRFPVGTAKSRLHSARCHLRRVLREE